MHSRLAPEYSQQQAQDPQAQQQQQQQQQQREEKSLGTHVHRSLFLSVIQRKIRMLLQDWERSLQQKPAGRLLVVFLTKMFVLLRKLRDGLKFVLFGLLGWLSEHVLPAGVTCTVVIRAKSEAYRFHLDFGCEKEEIGGTRTALTSAAIVNAVRDHARSLPAPQQQQEQQTSARGQDTEDAAPADSLAQPTPDVVAAPSPLVRRGPPAPPPPDLGSVLPSGPRVVLQLTSGQTVAPGCSPIPAAEPPCSVLRPARRAVNIPPAPPVPLDLCGPGSPALSSPAPPAPAPSVSLVTVRRRPAGPPPPPPTPPPTHAQPQSQSQSQSQTQTQTAQAAAAAAASVRTGRAAPSMPDFMADLQRKLMRRRRRISMHKFRVRHSSSSNESESGGKEKENFRPEDDVTNDADTSTLAA